MGRATQHYEGKTGLDSERWRACPTVPLAYPAAPLQLADGSRKPAAVCPPRPSPIWLSYVIPPPPIPTAPTSPDPPPPPPPPPPFLRWFQGLLALSFPSLIYSLYFFIFLFFFLLPSFRLSFSSSLQSHFFFFQDL
ncbi:hypothetical protein E2C01_084354 [Portunus trituberculatus]|uniref:Uncharacterized protein n=1 Tax=Portunus trituberculatus TaxID=210409 RepID=A0A5B7J412_PORTR|nr:hypothetical protein [Portunus trituberculatus]